MPAPNAQRPTGGQVRSRARKSIMGERSAHTGLLSSLSRWRRSHGRISQPPCTMHAVVREVLRAHRQAF
eukprot:scaffold14576_cov132-Isochrysis_galbana.AAC.11